jgi:hypothetical protein
MNLKYEFINDNDFLLKFKKYGQIRQDKYFRKTLEKNRQLEQEAIYHDLMSKYFLWSKFVILTDPLVFDFIIDPSSEKEKKETFKFQEKEYEVNYLIDERGWGCGHFSSKLFLFEPWLTRAIEAKFYLGIDQHQQYPASTYSSSTTSFSVLQNIWESRIPVSRMFIQQQLFDEIKEWAHEYDAEPKIGPSLVERIVRPSEYSMLDEKYGMSTARDFRLEAVWTV